MFLVSAIKKFVDGLVAGLVLKETIPINSDINTKVCIIVFRLRKSTSLFLC